MGEAQMFESIEELDRPSVIGRHLRQFCCMNPKAIYGMVQTTVEHWLNDSAPRLGAALAYYSIFSLAPLLLVVIAVAGLAFGQRAAQGQIFYQIREFVGPEGALAIERLLESARAPAQGITATVVAVVTLFFGASLVMNELKNSLNHIWNAPEPPPSKNILEDILRMMKQRFLSFAMVLGIGFLMLVSLIVNAVLAGLGRRVQEFFVLPEFALQGITLVVWFIVTAVLFALIYKLLPDVKITWTDVAIGSIVTSALFTVGKMLIALYLGKSGVTSAYGAAGSLVVILLWVYYSAQIFFLGAEFTKVYAEKYGSRLRSRLSPRPENLDATADAARIVPAS
jgi:membrane protein